MFEIVSKTHLLVRIIEMPHAYGEGRGTPVHLRVMHQQYFQPVFQNEGLGFPFTGLGCLPLGNKKKNENKTPAKYR